MRSAPSPAPSSSPRSTAPSRWGTRNQPDFLNLVVTGRTRLDPHALLAQILAIEARMGRERSFPNAPRLIDIDLLDHSGQVLNSPGLVLPHPRMAERGFVLEPLAEVAPQWRHPLLGRTARELLSAAPPRERVQRIGALDGG
jgi:2-amino-4-hydroxy-6-hydroxymethyldihydropteridine diphosphokinase